MIKEEVKIFDDSLALCEGFTAFIKKLLDVYPYINLSLSGGSTPKVLFSYWSDNCKDLIDWHRISFFWGDERCVPPEDKMNNYRMAKDYLFDNVPAIVGKSINRIHGENEPHEENQWYNKILTSKLFQRKGIPSFEVIMLGLGDDGHTVSIFPDQINLWDSKENCVVAQHPKTGMKRISLTGRVVNNSQYAVFLAMGKDKAEKVRDIVKNRKQFQSKYPAAKVDPKSGYLYWFLDREAASLL